MFPLTEKGSSPKNNRLLIKKWRSEEHTSELQSHSDLVCRLLLEKKKKKKIDANALFFLNSQRETTTIMKPPLMATHSLKGFMNQHISQGAGAQPAIRRTQPA